MMMMMHRKYDQKNDICRQLSANRIFSFCDCSYRITTNDQSNDNKNKRNTIMNEGNQINSCEQYHHNIIY